MEYDVSFSRFEGAGECGEDIPLAVVYHNALNPNFEIDVIDMRSHEPPYRLGEGVRVAVGSPYGCEHGDEIEPGASEMPIGTPYSNPCNPAILQGAHGLGIEGISIHRHYVALQYRAESLTHIAVMTKDAAAEDFLAGRPWKFTELVPHALEDDWDVDESVDEINEERAEVWGALDQLARRARRGVGRAWGFPQGDDLIGWRDRRCDARGRPGACIQLVWEAILRMMRPACATRSPVTRVPANCMISIRRPARIAC